MKNQIENFLSSRTYSEETKSTYRPVLIELANHAISEWSAKELLVFVNREKWGNSRRYVSLCACRAFIGWQFGKNHPALSARIKRVKPKRQRSMSFDQVIDLLALFDTYSPIGARDQALAALAIDTGLRESELARVQIADVDMLNRTLQVITKGGQWGVAVFSPDTAAILDRWLSFRKPAANVGSLFVSLAKNSRNGKPLTRHGIKSIFKKWGARLGWKLSPHDARRTFATISTIMGAPSRIVQAAGRWSNIDMVERYTRNIEASAITPYLPVTHALKKNT